MMRNQLFNRKILFSLLAVVMCFGFTAMSYGQATVSVEPAEVESPAAGENLEISINISGGADVAGYQVTVNFDPTALSYVSSADGGYLPTGAFPVPAVQGDGSVTVSAAAIGNVSEGDGTLATITFEVVEVKASTIGLSGVIISDSTSAALDVTTADSMVTAPAEAPAADDTAADDTADDAADDAADDTADDATDDAADDAAG